MALLVYRAAWTRDVLGQRVTRKAALAKLYATEAAQLVVDEAVQLFGGLGVTLGSTVTCGRCTSTKASGRSSRWPSRGSSWQARYPPDHGALAAFCEQDGGLAFPCACWHHDDRHKSVLIAGSTRDAKKIGVGPLAVARINRLAVRCAP